jgi:hypothetical protein
MQEDQEDYYNKGLNGQSGCCLVCPEAHEGCLCYDCKCKKCFYYSPPEGFSDKGSCDKVSELKEERKKELREYYKQKEEKEYQNSKKLEKYNEKIEEDIKNKKEVPFKYVCQKCRRVFIIDKEREIKPLKTPICGICSGEIQ